MKTATKHHNHHPAGRRWNVALLRTDGTFIRLERVKHLIQKAHVLVIYTGEHNVNRQEQWWPWDRIDHLVVEEATAKEE